jgi:hypothetical protein
MTAGYNDGSAKAPSGSPQLPSLLSGYSARPPWAVAGVDYYVGVPTGISLMDPATINMAGVSVNAATHLIQITGSNVTLSGYNFSLGGGWQIYIRPGASNTVIQNSNFKVGSNNQVPINAAAGAGNLTVQYCTLDGGSSQSGNAWTLINYNGSGTFVCEYNSFANAPDDAVDFNSGKMTPIIRYNVFYNLGTSPGSHPDPVQYVGVTSTNAVEAFNTIYQPNPGGMQGVQLQAQNGSTLINTAIQNNVIIAKGPAIDMSYSIAVIQNSGNTINGAAITNNYIDVTGAYGPFYPPSGSNLTFSGNTNIKTGQEMRPTSGSYRTSDVSGISVNPASGTLSPGATVTVTLSMDQAEFVTGTPTLSLNDGGVATYASGSGSNNLTFTYKVGSTDKSVSNLAVTQTNLPNGSTIQNGNGISANLSGALVTFQGLGVTGGPVIQPVAVGDVATTMANSAITIPVLANDLGGGGTINPGSVVINTAPAHGTATVNTSTGAISYNPASGFAGTDSFKYTFADTNGATSAPATGTITVTAPPAGAVYADGAANAPAGTPQLAGVLAGYAVRPPWKVAGVDYAVGVPSNLALKDPLSIAMAGVSIDASQHIVTVTGSNVTLNGYNFGLEGGWRINLATGAKNTIIENDSFSMGSTQPVAINASSTSVGDLTVLNCSFNGNSANIPSVRPPPNGSGIGSAINYNGSGTFVAEYNYIHDMPADGIDFSGGTVTPTVKYNVFKNLGTTPGAHPDPVQFYGDAVTNAQIDFNTIYSPQSGEVANIGLTIESQGGASITNTSLSNNVIVATGPALTQSINIGVFQDSGNTTSGVVVKNNYLDPTGSYGPFGSGGSTIQGSKLTFNGNMNMVTGKDTEPTQGTYQKSDVTGVSASPASGTQFPGTTVTLVLSMDQNEIVTGAPTLSLNTGGTATFSGGSGTNKLSFTYTVSNTDKTVPTLAVTQVNLPNGTSINNSNGDTANLSGAVTSLPGLGIDPPAPSGASTATSAIAAAPSMALHASGQTTPSAPPHSDTVTVGQISANNESKSELHFLSSGNEGSMPTGNVGHFDGAFHGVVPKADHWFAKPAYALMKATQTESMFGSGVPDTTTGRSLSHVVGGLVNLRHFEGQPDKSLGTFADAHGR